MQLFNSETQIVEEDVFLVLLVGVEAVADPDGAFLNDPVSLMIIVWTLPH